MKRRAAPLLPIALLLGLAACAAQSQFPELDEALNQYNQWKTVTVTKETRGNITNVRSDGPYRALMDAFNHVDAARYHELRNWVEQHKATVPSPVYWDLASRALQQKAPPEEVAHWLVIGGLSGFYDLSRCSDTQTTQGTFAELIYAHPELNAFKLENREAFAAGAQRALQWLQTNRYQASPMWTCASSMKAFTSNGHQAVGYADLVTPSEMHAAAYDRMLSEAEGAIAKDKAAH